VPPQSLEDTGVVADSLTGIQNAMAKCLFVVNRAAYTRDFRSSHRKKNPEDSNLARSVETMQ
jgi:hypothetical protein